MKYKFLNLQPLGRKEEDCVCRAISLGLDEDYYTIQHKLELIGDLFDCEELCVCCYKHLLDNVYELERYESYQGMTIEEFLNLNPKGTFIIRVQGHLTCGIDGVLYDIWDCRNEIVDIVWKVE
jgi:hypothetical protein|nr:MAG TPA: hypothetical protein [Caudoviricetes sp.]